MSVTVGILISRSDIMPTLPQLIVKGIKLAFENAGVEANFRIEDIGKGVVPDIVMAKANELIMHDVDITIAYAGKKVLDGLKLLYKNNKKPLMLMGMAPNIQREEEHGEAPYIASNSFDLWQTSYLLGKYAVHNIGKTGVASVGLFEGGYQFLPLFNEGVEEMGGAIAATHISKKLDETDFTNGLNDLLEQHKPDFLVEFYTGIDDERFYEVCVQKGVTRNLPLIALSLGAEPFEGSGTRIIHGFSWQPFIKNDTNTLMQHTYAEKHGDAPDVYVALAYETALWVIEGIKATGGKFNVNTYCAAITNATFEGPRGNFTVDREKNTNRPFPTIIIDGTNVATHEVSAEDKAKLLETFNNRISGGWFNPYPCA